MKTTGVIKLQRLSDGKLSQARKLRCNMTPPEYKLWQRIRNKQLGVKFRRQQVSRVEFRRPAKEKSLFLR
jgi:very-short-patch-repair endonuclease